MGKSKDSQTYQFRDYMIGLLIIAALFYFSFTLLDSFLTQIVYKNWLAKTAVCLVFILSLISVYQLYLWVALPHKDPEVKQAPIMLISMVIIISGIAFYAGVLKTPWSPDDANSKAWEIINGNVTQTYIHFWITVVLIISNIFWMHSAKKTDRERSEFIDRQSREIRRLHSQRIENEQMIERRSVLLERIKERDRLRQDHLYIDEGVLDDYGFKLGLKDLFSSTLILGATGSGKTAASGMLISRYLLGQKMGGLILTYKTGEADDWKERLKLSGYDENDIIVFSHDAGSQCDFLAYEARRQPNGTADITNFVDILKTVGQLATSGDVANGKDGDSESYWENAALSLLRQVLTFLYLAVDGTRLDLIISIVNEMEHGPIKKYDQGQRDRSVLLAFHNGMVFDEADTNTLQKNPKPLRNCSGRVLTPSETRDFTAAWEELTQTFPSLNDRTKSSIVKRLEVMLSPLRSGKMADMFASGEVSVCPEMTFEGKVIILDLSLQAYGMLGRVAQGVWKYLFQKAVERRPETDERPVFLWVDEAHYFLNELDQRFLTTVRSKKCVTVFLTQNISNFITAIDENPTKAMLGNFKTQIFHRNDSFDTNEYSADLIGKYWHRQINQGSSDSTSETSGVSHGESTSIGTSMSTSLSITDSKATGRSGGVVGHLFMPPSVTNYYSSRASLSLTSGTSESTTSGTSETKGTTTSHSESYSSSKSTSSGFTEIREYLVQPDELKRLNDNYGDIEGYVYFAGKDLGNNQPYKRALFDPLDLDPEMRFVKAAKKLEGQGVQIARDDAHVEKLTMDNEQLDQDLSKEWQRVIKIPKAYYEDTDFGGYEAPDNFKKSAKDENGLASMDAEDISETLEDKSTMTITERLAADRAEAEKIQQEFDHLGRRKVKSKKDV